MLHIFLSRDVRYLCISSLSQWSSGTRAQLPRFISFPGTDIQLLRGHTRVPSRNPYGSLPYTHSWPTPQKNSQANSSLRCSNDTNSFYSYLVILLYCSNNNCLAAEYDIGLPALTSDKTNSFCKTVRKPLT